VSTPFAFGGSSDGLTGWRLAVKRCALGPSAALRVTAASAIRTGQAELELETAPLDGTGPDQTVLAARMNNDYTPFPNASFPVYTLSSDHGSWWGTPRSQDRGPESACQGTCAVFWPPVLTSGRPEAGPGVDQRAIGVIVRPGRHPAADLPRAAAVPVQPGRLHRRRQPSRDTRHLRSRRPHPIGRVQHNPAAALKLPPFRNKGYCQSVTTQTKSPGRSRGSHALPVSWTGTQPVATTVPLPPYTVTE